MPNQDQITGVLRVVIPMLCTWLATMGISALGDANIVAQITTVAIGVVAVVWTLWAHTNAQKLKAAAAIDPHISIQVPERVIVNDVHIGAVVADKNIPNVTSKEGPPHA